MSLSAFISGSVDTVSQILEKEVLNKTLQKPRTQSPTRNTDRNTNQRPPEADPLRIGPPMAPRPMYGGVGYDPIRGGQWPPPVGGADLGSK